MGSAASKKRILEECGSSTKLDVSGHHLSTSKVASVKMAPLLHLTWINASFNDLERIPPKYGKLSNLTRLDLRGNRLRFLPPEVSLWTSMVRLEVGHNMISTLPPGMFEALPNLEELSLPRNLIEELPIQIGWCVGLKKLVLYVNKITSLPVELGLCKSLTDLDLGMNRLDVLPETLSSLDRLIKLNLHGNNLDSLSPQVGLLEPLQRLDVRFNGLSTLPEELGQLSHLKYLWIANNQLTHLPPTTGHLAGLSTLIADHNHLDELEPEIGRLSNLTMLNLSHNRLTHLPPQLGALSSLRTLDVSHNAIDAIPPEFGGMASLQTLKLDWNALCSLPCEIASLCSMTDLSAQHNSLKCLPDEIGDLSHLHTLDVQYNHLDCLPDSLDQCSKLEMLFVGFNRLAELPQCCATLPDLRIINVTGNPIEHMPPTLASKALDRLLLGYTRGVCAPPMVASITVLAICGNGLESIPEAVFEMTKLKVLHASCNRIDAIPGEIKQLSRLESLDLTGNRLCELPKEIGSLSCLRELCLSHNHISRLPADMGSLVELTTCDLSGNAELSMVPEEMAALPSLRVLKLNCCTIRDLPRGLGESKALMWVGLESCGIKSPKSLAPSLRSKCEESLWRSSKSTRGLGDARGSKSRMASAEWMASVGYKLTWADMKGVRPTQEDATVVHTCFRGDPDACLLAVFDGHAGADAAVMCGIHVGRVLEKALAKCKNNVEEAFARTFHRLDDMLCSATDSGTTAAVVLVMEERVWVANVGDTRVVRALGGKAHRVSVDHLPVVVEERQRIYHSGGFVSEKGYVNGDVAVSRSLGDAAVAHAVICSPHVCCVARDEVDVLLIACDGVWDEFEDQGAVDVVLQHRGENPAAALRDIAYLSGSTDNISTLVVDFTHPIDGHEV